MIFVTLGTQDKGFPRLLEAIDKEIEKGMSDVKAGRVYSADAIEAEMKRDFGI